MQMSTGHQTLERVRRTFKRVGEPKIIITFVLYIIFGAPFYSEVGYPICPGFDYQIRIV